MWQNVADDELQDTTALSGRIVQIISNPISGRPGARPALLQCMEHELAAAGFEPRVTPTQHRHHATELAAAAPADAHAVVAVGGDGTIREIAAGLLGRGVPLAVYPTGTENVLAKHFRIKGKIEHLVEMLRARRTLDYDLGMCNEHPFLLMVGAGIDAEMVHHISRTRRGHLSYLSYFGPGWRALWGYRLPRVAVEVDGREVYSGRGMVWIGNIRRYAGGTTILRRARIDDGLLDVCVLPCASKPKLLTYAMRLWTRTLPKSLPYFQGRHVRIRPQEGPVNVQIDGDYAGVLPVECRILPAALKLLVPPDYVAAG